MGRYNKIKKLNVSDQQLLGIENEFSRVILFKFNSENRIKIYPKKSGISAHIHTIRRWLLTYFT